MKRTQKGNILLVNPPVYDFALFDLYLKPLGLLYIAAVLIKEGYNCYLIDCLDYNTVIKHKKYGTGKFQYEVIEKPPILKNIPRRYKRYGMTKYEFINKLNSLPPIDVIIITSLMTYWYLGVIEIIEIIRNYFKNKPIILGGKYPTLCYEHCKKSCEVDYIIQGEGELPVLKLVNELTNNKSDYEKYKTIDELPNPAFELYNNPHYICILTTRGCPYRCSYCAAYILSNNFKKRHPEKVISEIEYYYNKGIHNFAFYDDALLCDKQHITQILQGIIDKKIKVSFHTPNGLNARYIDSEIAQLLKEAGFKTIRIGLETIDEELQNITGDKVNNTEFKEAVNNLRKVGFASYEIGVYILVGLHNQTLQEVKQAVEFVYNCGAQPILVEYSPIPCTKDFDHLKEFFILNPAIDPLLHNNSILPFNSKYIKYDEFQELKNIIMRRDREYFDNLTIV